MDRKEVDARIEQACRQLDERFAAWQRRLRKLALPLVVPAAMVVPVVGAGCVEIETDAGDRACEDDIDNDGDGEVDCEDEDCLGEPPCSVDLYGVP